MPIREAVELAQRTTKELEVKRYLARALKYFKGNAAGTTKFAALWLAAQVKRSRPELWTLEAMQVTPADGPADGRRWPCRWPPMATECRRVPSMATECH